MKKIVSVILCFAVIFSLFCACKREADDAETTTQTEETTTAISQSKPIKKEVTLGYYGNQPFNPYTTQSRTNASIAGLLYSSLFRIDSSYNAASDAASTYTYGDSSVTVTLRDNIYFSNSQKLTANDVVYSFAKARKSPIFSGRLVNFKSAVASGSDIVFKLKKADIYAINCLDFPIIYSGSAKKGVPVGSGRYIMSKKNGKYSLLKNENYSGNEEVSLEKINLTDINEKTNELYLLQVGDLSFAFDNLAKQHSKYKINANTAEVSLNNLLYLAFNSASEQLARGKNIVEAISLALDKTTICSKAYGSGVSVCKNVFNPAWSEASQYSFGQQGADLISAQQMLEKDGFVYEYETNAVHSKNFEYLELDFIVCSSDKRKVKAAREIKNELTKLGIGINLDELEYDEYISRLQKGEYDIYLGEIKLSANMSLYEFFSADGSVNYGIDANSTVSSAYSDFAGGKIDIATFINVFDEYKPFIPLGYRTGTVYYSRELQYEGEVSENDIFSNIFSWDIQ